MLGSNVRQRTPLVIEANELCRVDETCAAGLLEIQHLPWIGEHVEMVRPGSSRRMHASWVLSSKSEQTLCGSRSKRPASFDQRSIDRSTNRRSSAYVRYLDLILAHNHHHQHYQHRWHSHQQTTTLPLRVFTTMATIVVPVGRPSESSTDMKLPASTSITRPLGNEGAHSRQDHTNTLLIPTEIREALALSCVCSTRMYDGYWVVCVYARWEASKQLLRERIERWQSPRMELVVGLRCDAAYVVELPPLFSLLLHNLNNNIHAVGILLLLCC